MPVCLADLPLCPLLFGRRVSRRSRPSSGATKKTSAFPRALYVSVCLCVCVSLSFFVVFCHSVSVSVTLCLSLCHSVTLSLCVCHSVTLSLCLCHSVSVILSFCLRVRLSIFVSLCLSVSLSLNLLCWLFPYAPPPPLLTTSPSRRHRQKRMKQIKKLVARGLYQDTGDNPFDTFMATARVRWTYYHESEKVLGNTYGMCVLQDFEALTPNLLCRTIETVEGGGVIVLLLKTLSSLKQLYTLSMDVHARLRTEAHQDVVARFNERFLLSVTSCAACLCVDDELNVLPISRHAKAIEPVVVRVVQPASLQPLPPRLSSPHCLTHSTCPHRLPPVKTARFRTS